MTGRTTQKPQPRSARLVRRARPAKRAPSTVKRELLDSFSKVVERQLKVMAKRVDQTNHRLDKLFECLDQLRAKDRASPAYEPDNGPLTQQQLRAIQKRAKRELGTTRKSIKMSKRLF